MLKQNFEQAQSSLQLRPYRKQMQASVHSPECWQDRSLGRKSEPSAFILLRDCFIDWLGVSSDLRSKKFES